MLRGIMHALVVPAGGIPYNNEYFGRGIGPVYLTDVQCLGSEVNLTGCQHSQVGSFTDECNYTSDVGVTCYNQTKGTMPVVESLCIEIEKVFLNSLEFIDFLIITVQCNGPE